MEGLGTAESLIPRFKLNKLLNQGPEEYPPLDMSNLFIDRGGLRVTLLGTIDSSPALLTAERAAFPSDLATLETLNSTLANLKNLGDNDIYRWYLASSGAKSAKIPDLKLNLIFPCTEQHVKKYSPQVTRVVNETPEVYSRYVRPYMEKKRNEGRLNWVFNILEGRTEQEDVLLRDPGQGINPDDGFLLLPDLNWDRKTVTSLHLLGLVVRRDIWSLRDLKKGHVEWLKHMRNKIINATIELYKEVERDMLKLYVHCNTHFFHCHQQFYLKKTKVGQTNQPTTTSTSTWSIPCSNPPAPKPPEKLSGLRTSYPN